jgi:hypothetical protein
MVLTDGFWHDDTHALSTNTTFKACKYATSCAAFRVGENSTMNCSQGSQGRMCSFCDAGFSKLGGGTCVLCGMDSGSAGQVVSVCALFVALLGFLVYMHSNAKHPADTVGLPMKIFIDFCQMLSSLSIFSIVWSKDMLFLFDTASTANFGASFGSVTCITLSYSTTLILNVLSPLIVFGMLATTLVIMHWAFKGGEKELDIVLGRAVMVVLFLTYASVTSASMSFFHCDTFGDRRFLVANYSLECGSDEYDALMPWAILGWMVVICVPLFWGLGIMALSRHSRWSKHLKFTRRGNRGICYRVAGSMYSSFLNMDPETGLPKRSQGCDIAIAWEAVRMVRKAGLIALSVFYALPEYRSAQLCLGLVWLNIHMAILLLVQPYTNYMMKLLELGSLLTITFTLALGKIDESETSDSNSTDAASALFVLIVICNCVFALCVVFVAFLEVHEQKKRKCRAQELWRVFRLSVRFMPRIMASYNEECGQDGRPFSEMAPGSCSTYLRFFRKKQEGATSERRRSFEENSSVESGAGSGMEMQTITSNAGERSAYHCRGIGMGTRSADESMAAPVLEGNPAQNEEWEDSSPVLKEGASDVAMDNAGSRALNSRISDAVNLADKLISAASEGSDLEKNLPMPPEALTHDFEEEEILDPPSAAPPRARQMSLMITEDGDEYYLDNATNETMWDLPDGSILV